MPGFGSGPFGSDPFGEWKWSRRVLYEYIPEVYRVTDAAEEGLLETFSDSLRPSFDELRRQIRDLDELRDPLQVRTQFSEVGIIKLGNQVIPVGELEQRGQDARVDAINQLIAPGGRFSILDLGKEITITNSVFEVNNKTAVIASIINTTTVLTEPPFAVDAGPLTWELRPVVDIVEGVVTVQVRGGDVSAVKPGWILGDGFAQFTIQARRQFPTIASSPTFLTEREGNDGTISGIANFESPSIAFTQGDVGKLISISTSVIPTNNNRFEILEVVSATEAVVANNAGDPPTLDGQPFFWALLPFAELDLTSTIEPRGTVEQDGLLASITVSGLPSTFVAPSGEFTIADIGKRLTISGSAIPANNTSVEVFDVPTANTLLLADTLTVDGGPLRWELRRSTAIGDLNQVRVRSTSMITRLARDFGIEIDTQENQDRQRSWVANVSRWIQQKGTQKGYEILANISGFNVEVIPLYRVSIDRSTIFDTLDLFEIGESGEDRSGTDGTLSQPGLNVRFSSPTATFLKSDCGVQIRIRDATVLANEKLYTIETFIDANTVEMRGADTVTLPEGSNGSLTWAVIRLYTSQAPLLANFDEMNEEFMEELVDGLPVQTTDFFGIDKYCWEPDYFSDVEITIDSVSAVSPGVYAVIASDGPPQGPSSIIGNASVIQAIGNWVVIDSSAETFFVETTPSVAVAAIAATETLTGTANFADTETISIDGKTYTFQTVLTDVDGNVLIGVDLVASLNNLLLAINQGTGGGVSYASSTTLHPTVSATGTTATTLTVTAKIPGIGGNLITVGAGGAANASWGGGFLSGGLNATYTFQVNSASAPATGSSVLRYSCPTQLTCDYCAASRVLLRLTLGSLASETGVAVERVLDRMLLRFDDATPAHVKIVPVLTQDIEASLNIAVTVDTAEIVAAILVPKDAHYDDFPADIIVADPAGISTTVPHYSDVGQADYPYTDLVLRCTVETP